MCLEVDKFLHEKRLLPLEGQVGYKPKVAKRDIPCYKRMLVNYYPNGEIEFVSFHFGGVESKKGLQN